MTGNRKLDKLAERIAKTEQLFSESQSSTSTTATSTGNKLADLIAKKQQFSALSDADKFQSQADYTAALLSMPEPTHDANGEPYALPNRMQLALQNAALAKAENPSADPDAEIHEQIRRDTLMAQPPQTVIEDAAHPSSAPRSHQEWMDRANALHVRAQRSSLFVLVVPGSHLPVALGPGGQIIEVNSLRLSTDPSGLNVLAQGSLQSVTAALAFEERDRASKQRALADMDVYRAKQQAEFAEAREEQAMRNNAPQTILALQKAVAELQQALAEKS